MCDHVDKMLVFVIVQVFKLDNSLLGASMVKYTAPLPYIGLVESSFKTIY